MQLEPTSGASMADTIAREVTRQPWQEPAIVLEHSLVAQAQEGTDGSEDPFMGPLNVSP